MNTHIRFHVIPSNTEVVIFACPCNSLWSKMRLVSLTYDYD